MNIKNWLLPLSLFLFSSMQGWAQAAPINIIPQPVSLKVHDGHFILSNSTFIIANDDTRHEAEMLNLYLNQLYGFSLKISSKHTSGMNSIELVKEKSANRKDAYTIEVSANKIRIASVGNEGIFYGIQSLLQLMPTTKPVNAQRISFIIPQLSINDFPRFAYRGMHLDVSRHFFDVDFIKKYLDYLAYNKFNTFHWHLTDDQGWRIEIKKYPLLTSVGGYRNGTIIGQYPGTGNDSIVYGGFYTQNQIKEIVKYASDRFITVIPEIEMPGHASAAIAAYPQLSCFPGESTKPDPKTIWAGSLDGKQVQQAWGVFEDIFAPTDYTFTFLENVLDEVMVLFPSKYIHIGGDEAPKDSWKRSPFSQKLISDNNLQDEHGLQSYFIHRIEKYLNAKGRKIIGWDEILEGGLAPNATVMSWRGEEGGITAAQQKHDVIMTPGTYCYFDHSQAKNDDSVTIGGYLPVEKVYSYEPVPAALSVEEEKYILGAQANLWTEYIQYPSKVEYMIFPRMSALSEVLWSSKEEKDWNRFSAELRAIIKRYALWGANFSTAYYDLQSSIIPTDNNNGVVLKLWSNYPDNIIKYQMGSDPYWKDYSTPIVIKNSEIVHAYLQVSGKKGNTIIKDFSFNKATGKKITLSEQPSPNYPGSGEFTLVNGIVAANNLSSSSEWLGFNGKDLTATIDLGTMTQVNSVTLKTLDMNGSWIYLPKSIEIMVSDDGITFTEAAKIDRVLNPGKDQEIREFILQVNKSARYLKVFAKNLGMIPGGLPGAGEPAWLFVDEIQVN
ncbi:MAG: family 20 glycosylhydrolase [Ginsengibacter sp.]